MKPPHPAARLPLLAGLALATALVACSRQQPDDELSVGQRVDNAAADRTAQVTADMGITAKVNAALVADDQLKATQINVDTRDGQVTLSGQASDAKSRERASTLAAAVDGVKQVNNQLAITRDG